MSAEVVEDEVFEVDDFVVVDVLVVVVEELEVDGVVEMVIVGSVGGIVTIVRVVEDVVDDVDGSVLIVVGSVGSVVQSLVIGQRDGRDCAADEKTSEAAP